MTQTVHATMQAWTIREQLRSMLRAVARQPWSALLALVVLPGLWAVPPALLHDAFVPVEIPVFGPGRSLSAAAVSLMVTAWGAVWFPGQLAAALAVVRGNAIRWSVFVTGLTTAPALFLAALVVELPLEVVGLLPAPEDTTLASAAEVMVGMIYIGLIVRTLFSGFFILDAGQSIRTAIISSWRATRGHLLRILGLGVMVECVWMAVMVTEGLLVSENGYVATATVDGLTSLRMAQLYLLVVVAPDDGDRESEKARAPTEDLRETGTGWSRRVGE